MKDQSKAFGFDGKGGEYFVLAIKNFFLRMVTFGIYGFQAKVKVRQYMWGHTWYKGERFGFAGQAMDQVRGLGWLFAMAFGLFVGAGLAYLVHPVLAIPFVYCGIALLVIRMQFGGFRYKVRNTVYRNLRGNVAPQAFDVYLKQAVKGAFLTMLTLGIYRSWNQMALMKIKWGHASWGRQKFEFTGNGKEFFWLQVKGVLLTMITFGIYTPWFVASRYRYFANNLKFMDQKFHCDITGGQIFLQTFALFVGSAMTFGIAYPWLMVALTKQMAGTLSYLGDIDFSKIEADLRASGKDAGDGAADVLDFDHDLDFAV